MPQKSLSVKVVAYTPKPEQVVAVASKLCYSNKTTEELLV